MFTRAGRIAATAAVVIVACAALIDCGGGMRSPTEPAAVTPTPLPAPAPTSTPPSPTPTPAPTNVAVFGYVGTVLGTTQHFLSGVVLRVHQDGTADQIENSGSLDGYYAFCCLHAGPAAITATLTGYRTYTATITIGQTP